MAWLVPALPILVMLAAGLGSRRAGTERGVRGRLAALGGAGMGATTALALVAAGHGWSGTIPWSGDLSLRLDFAAASSPVAALFAVLVPVIAAPVLVYGSYHEEASGLGRLVAVLSLSVAAMEVIAGATDLVTLLLGWELIGACSAVLVGHEWGRREAPRAAVVVFLTTRTGDLGLFLAAMVAFAGAGSPGYGSLTALHGPALQMAVGGILVAAAAKSAQVPFAPWLFAAMEGPVSVSTLLHAATMVASGAFLLIRLHPILAAVAWFGPAAVAIGLVTALTAGLVGLLQPHAKRLLAGSTSAQYGLMFVGVGAGFPVVAALHLVGHAFAKAALFLVSGIGKACSGDYRLRLMKMGRQLPGIAAASAVVAAAIGGIPPLGVAWSKEAVVSAAGHAGPWLAAITAVAGGLSAAYMGRFQLQAFGRGRGICAGREPRAGERWPLFLLTAASAALSLLWLGSVHHAVGGILDGGLPGSEPWETVISLLLVAAGLATGAVVAWRRPELGEVGSAAALARWLGLPALAHVGIVRPVLGLTRVLAEFDDRVVDRGVRFTAAVALRLGRLGRGVVEVATDAVPEGLARLTGVAGRRTRRLQSGLAHQYYRLMVLGLALLLLVLLVLFLGA